MFFVGKFVTQCVFFKNRVLELTDGMPFFKPVSKNSHLAIKPPNNSNFPYQTLSLKITLSTPFQTSLQKTIILAPFKSAHCRAFRPFFFLSLPSKSLWKCFFPEARIVLHAPRRGSKSGKGGNFHSHLSFAGVLRQKNYNEFERDGTSARDLFLKGFVLGWFGFLFCGLSGCF